jgi:hypothetical protein
VAKIQRHTRKIIYNFVYNYIKVKYQWERESLIKKVINKNAIDENF